MLNGNKTESRQNQLFSFRNIHEEQELEVQQSKRLILSFTHNPLAGLALGRRTKMGLHFGP